MSQKRDMGHPGFMVDPRKKRIPFGKDNKKIAGVLALIDKADGFHENVAVDGEAPHADFVQGVLGGVVVAVVGAVVEVDDVDGGDAALDEGEMVVFDFFVLLNDESVVTAFVLGLLAEAEA